MNLRPAIPLVFALIAGFFVACNQPSDLTQTQDASTSVSSQAKTDSKNDARVQLSLTSSDFRKNGKIAIVVTVSAPLEAPPAPEGVKVAPRPTKEEITLQLFPTEGIELKDNTFEFKLKPGTSRSFNLNAQAVRAGYASLTVMADAQT